MTRLQSALLVSVVLLSMCFPAQAATLLGVGARGVYQIELESPGELQLNLLESWILTVLDAAGSPVENAIIAIDGGMPAHGHGLPTAPAITEELGEGRYRLDGVKFNMMGEWVLRLAIEGAAGSDEVTIEFEL